MARRMQVVMDCADPARMAAFWAEALGYVEQPPPGDFDTWAEALTSMGVPEEDHGRAGAIVDPDGVGPRVFFQGVPEGKVTKNRVHLDVFVDLLPDAPDEQRHAAQDAEVARLVGLGATKLEEVLDMGFRHVVLQDPEGNEFCVA